MVEINNSIIGGKRCCGKTHEMILKSNKDWLYIVCVNYQQVENIVTIAKSMKVDIPYPITVSELPIARGANIKGVLIEEIEQVLEMFIKCPIVAASTSMHMKEMNHLIEAVNSKDGTINRMNEMKDAMVKMYKNHNPANLGVSEEELGNIIRIMSSETKYI
ncbi:hypothetical protein [Viridibacillus arvi]|uniref:hypothetical protein n=1 Tax=Viridibacillus arvi TaxID=263475 RepID=UPI0034CFE27D